MHRFYVVVRADLTPGQQLAQAVHAALNFFHQHPTVATDWISLSNYLVILNAPDEESLYQLLKDADETGIVTAKMHESDLDDEITAIALQPGHEARMLCAQFPLALRGEKL